MITGNFKFAGRESESGGRWAGAGDVNPWRLSRCHGFKLLSQAVMMAATLSVALVAFKFARRHPQLVVCQWPASARV